MAKKAVSKIVSPGEPWTPAKKVAELFRTLPKVDAKFKEDVEFAIRNTGRSIEMGLILDTSVVMEIEHAASYGKPVAVKYANYDNLILWRRGSRRRRWRGLCPRC
jgi:hypothetical protein